MRIRSAIYQLLAFLARALRRALLTTRPWSSTKTTLLKTSLPFTCRELFAAKSKSGLTARTSSSYSTKNPRARPKLLKRLNKMSAAEWKGFFAAHKDSILFVDTDADVLKAVQAEPGAIGLIEVHSIDNSISVVTVDGKLPMEFGYLPH
jgi:hypothetical protein